MLLFLMFLLLVLLLVLMLCGRCGGWGTWLSELFSCSFHEVTERVHSGMTKKIH